MSASISTAAPGDVFVGGSQFGANFPVDRFVVGIEWDLDYMKNNSNYDDGVHSRARTPHPRIILQPLEFQLAGRLA